MPITGYCSKCKKYVWLNEKGVCPKNHAPNFITDVYDAPSEADFPYSLYTRPWYWFQEQPLPIKIALGLVVVFITMILFSVFVSSLKEEFAMRKEQSVQETDSSISAKSIESSDSSQKRAIYLDSSRGYEWLSATHEQKLVLAEEYKQKRASEIGSGPWDDSEWLVSKTDEYYQKEDNLIQSISLAMQDVMLQVELQKANEIYEKRKANLPNIKLGMTQDEVRNLLDEPTREQSSETSYGKTDYWYYDFENNTYQFVFENGKLRAKNKY